MEDGNFKSVLAAPKRWQNAALAGGKHLRKILFSHGNGIGYATACAFES
jgi:hypothetical protein